MPSDLPDYTRLISVNVEIPEVEVGPVNVGWYKAAPADLPDGTRGPLLTDVKGRLIIVQYEKDRTVETASGKFVRVKGPATDEVPATVETASGKYVRVKGHASDEVPVTFSDQEIIPRPKGGILAKGSVTTTAAYQTVATHTVTTGKTFQLAKILVSCDEDFLYKLRWNGTDISVEVYVSGAVPFTDWFPWNYYSMPGDGAKAFDVQAKYPTGGSAGTCQVEIVGEEV